MNAPTLQANLLTKQYGSTRALDGVSLEIAPGTSTAIMGASGSGKTTLLHVLAGILLPDSGTVSFDGVPITSVNDRERSRLRRDQFGFVFQQGLLLPELTAIENVALALMLQGQSKSQAIGPAAHALATLGLAGLEDRRIGELSGGQAQRVAIARAQVTGAKVVFADEPTGALDSTTSSEVMDALLASTVAQGRTLVMVTHDATVAARCQRVISVRDGQIVSDSAGTMQRPVAPLVAPQAAPSAAPQAAPPLAPQAVPSAAPQPMPVPQPQYMQPYAQPTQFAEVVPPQPQYAQPTQYAQPAQYAQPMPQPTQAEQYAPPAQQQYQQPPVVENNSNGADR